MERAQWSCKHSSNNFSMRLVHPTFSVHGRVLRCIKRVIDLTNHFSNLKPCGDFGSSSFLKQTYVILCFGKMWCVAFSPHKKTLVKSTYMRFPIQKVKFAFLGPFCLRGSNRESSVTVTPESNHRRLLVQ